MEADAAAAGELGFNFVTGEVRGVVADLVDLVRARSFDVVEVEGAGDGSDEDVAVFALRAAEVEVREAEDDSVAGVAEAGAAAVEGLHVGTEFDEAVGDGGADEGVAAPVDADEGVDVVGVVVWDVARFFARRVGLQAAVR